MSSSMLDVDEDYLAKKLLMFGKPDDDEDSEGIWPGFIPKENTPKILTPSQREEASKVMVVIPKPGLCVKTWEVKSGKKFFINVCHSSEVPNPNLRLTDAQLANILSNGTDNEVDDVRIAMSIGEKREEKDKSQSSCFACDVIVNSEFFKEKLLGSDMYRIFFVTIAIEGIEEKHKVELDKNGYKFLQNAKAMGKLAPQFLKNKAGIREVDSSEPIVPSKIIKSSKIEEVNVPTQKRGLEITLIQVSEELAKAQTKFPNRCDPRKIAVQVGGDRIVITSPVGSLDLYFPLEFQQENCQAEYSRTTNTLSLTLPLIAKDSDL